MKKLVLTGTLALLAGVAAASVYAPGGFLSEGSIELSPTLHMHAVCDVHVGRVVYVAAQTGENGGVAITISDRTCTVPDDTPNNLRLRYRP